MRVTLIIEGEGYQRSVTSATVSKWQIYRELEACLLLIRRQIWDYGLVKGLKTYSPSGASSSSAPGAGAPPAGAGGVSGAGGPDGAPPVSAFM